MLGYVYVAPGRLYVYLLVPMRCRCPRCRGESNVGQYLYERPSHQAWQCAACRARHYRGPRDGGSCRAGGRRGAYRQAGRPCYGKCGDLLRRMFFLPSWFCKQLYRPSRRLGARLPHRRRSGRVCACALCRQRTQPYSRWGGAMSRALFVGDILATGFWAARISEIKPDDTVLIIGAGPTGICTLLCAQLHGPQRIIVCEKSPERAAFVRRHYPGVEVVSPEECLPTIRRRCERGGADVVLEVAGSDDSFRLAWECARPNAVVTIVALYDKPQVLPLPEMYGQESYLQDRWSRRLRLCRDTRPHSRRTHRHYASHHASFCARRYRRGLPYF